MRNVCFTTNPPFEEKERRERAENPYCWHIKYIPFELKVLPTLFCITNSKIKTNESELKKQYRDVNSRIIALEGVLNAILTGTMCIALDELEKERESWWQSWQLGPPERLPRFQRKDEPLNSNSLRLHNFFPPTRYIRHELRNVITKIPDVGVETGVQSFDIFIRAIQDRFENRLTCNNATSNGIRIVVPGTDTGRRLHLILAHRGGGKGSFLSALSSKVGLKNYITASWPKNIKKPQPVYLSLLSINLSFSTEIASTFDMLETAIWETFTHLKFLETLKRNYDDLLKETKETQERFRQLPRQQRLKQALRNFDYAAKNFSKKNYQPRLIIAINAIDLYHYQMGLIKNREITEFLEMILGEEISNLPIDIILISGEENMSELLVENDWFTKLYNKTLDDGSKTKTSENLVFIPTFRPDINPSGIQNINRRMHRCGLKFSDNMHLKPKLGDINGATIGDIEDKLTYNNIAYVHFAKTVKPETLLIDNFLPLATILFVGFIHRRKELTKSDPIDYKKARLEDLKIRISDDEYDKVWTSENPDGQQAKLRKDQKDYCYETIKKIAADNDYIDSIFQKSDPDAYRPLMTAMKKLHKATGKDLIITAHDVLTLRYDCERKDSPDKNRAFFEWRQIRNILGSNRYSLTLILACAEKIAVNCKTLSEGCEKAEGFIRSTVDRVKMVSESKREEIVITDVMDGEFN